MVRRLYRAPVIVGRLDDRDIRTAARRVRLDYSAAPVDGGSLRKLDGDIWAMEGPLGLHVDGTAPGHRVIGVVLVNDDDLMLFQYGIVYDLPVGTIFHLQGRHKHGALPRNVCGKGMFGFLAWDVPRDLPLDDLLEDLPLALRAYGAREQRVNVLA